jgi:hypothetical protein
MTLQDLRQVFSTAVSIDEMSLLLVQSPFCKSVVMEYYDGATAGFACAAGSVWVYFKKAWWDDGQDLRVFWGYVLNDLSHKARDTLERCSGEDWSKALPSVEAVLLKALAEEAVHKRDSRMTIVCRNISRGLVIFSDTPD